MKFKLHWLGRKTEVVEGDDIAKACNNAGIGNGAVKALDYFENEVKLSDIAHGRLGITTQVASFYIDELAGYPNLSEGLEITRNASIHSWTMFSRNADEFVRRVEEYREQMLKPIISEGEVPMKELKKFVCRWCEKEFDSELGLFCPLCCRFQETPKVINLSKPSDV